MKRKAQIAIISSLLAFSFVGAAASTIAWFSTRLDIDMKENITGESNGAYFASGTGESGDPFIINSPVHLYNLAWLQYLGYFNNNTIGASSGPTYFAIDPNLQAPIDMTGWILPPIGTTLNPFVGVFNGNGKTIANLTTINSSNVADYPKKPYPVRQAGVVENVNVLGLFGVVGTCNLSNTGVTSLYPAAGYSANAISNFYIDNGHVKNHQSSTLAGIAAGYVNAPLSGVGISSSDTKNPSSVNVSNAPTVYGGKTNISDFTSIGYCEDAYKTSISRNYSELYDPTSKQELSGFVAQETGDDAGWGGSIPMSEMFSSLSTVKQSAISAGALRYPTTKTINYDYNGVASDPVYGSYTTSNNMRTVENTSYYTKPVSYDYNYYTYEQKDGNDVTSSYSIVNYSNNDFTCLSGEKTVYIRNAMTTTTNRFETVGDCFYITYTVDGNTHYLSQNNGTLNDTTTPSSATVWALDENNYIYTVVGQTNPQTTYYLRNNNGTLQVSDSTPTQWSTDNSRTYFKNNSYAIQFNASNSTWYLVEASDATYNIKISNQNYYINANGTSGVAASGTATTHWYFESNNGYYILSGGTKYYLGWNIDSSKVGLGTWSQVVDGNNILTYMLNNNRTNPTGTAKLSYYNGSEYWYLYRRNNGNMDETNKQNTGSTFAITQYSAAAVTNPLSCPSATGFKKYTSSTTTEDSPLQLKPTFFPLKHNNGVPLETNTGYLISGGNYTTDQMGDIRFGKFDQARLPNKLNTVYTIQNNAGTSININDSDIVSDANRKSVYDNSKATMQKVLNEDTSGIYGLHFMSATIGSGASVIVPKAIVNGNTYYNYEMPTDCIDFNLKTKGYINFFAGSYFYNNTSGRNNSFFTLHEIQRTSNPSDASNPNPIEKINEIVRIYSDGVESHSYVYEYANADENGYKYSVPFKFNELGQRITLTDGTYTPYSRMNTLYTGYSSTAVFDSDWIGVNTLSMTTSGSNYNGYAYYFDISMNAGEYALGSVPGGVGAYLIYLDIGANATKVYRSTVVELIHTIAESFTKPLGIALVVAGAASVNDVNSYCITIKTQYQGVVTVARESAIAATYTESVPSNLVYLSYAYEELAVNTNEQAVADTKVEQTIKRVNYFDYAASDNSTTKTTISQIATTTTNLGVASDQVTSYSVEQYKHYSSSSSGDKVADNAIKVFNDDGEQMTSTQYWSAAFFNGYASPTSMTYQFATYSSGIGTITMNIVLTTNQQNSESYNLFSARGYSISITLTDDQGNVTDITSQCTIFAKDNNTYVVDQQTGKILLVIHDEFILNDATESGD